MQKSKRAIEVKDVKAEAGVPWWPWAAACAALMFILYEVYRPALNGPFLFDDFYLPFLVPDFAENPLRLWVAGMRPTLQATYWLNYKASGLDPYPYHLLNLVLHAAAGYFVYLISSKLLALANTTRSVSAVLAAFVAVVFLLHPLQTESVAYVASRSEVLSGLFFLIAWTVFLYRKDAAIGFSETVLVMIFFVLALTSKEHTAVLPAVLLLTDYFFNPGFTFDGIRRNWRLYAPLFAGAAIGVAVIFRVVLSSASSAGFGMKDLTPLDYLFTQFRSIVTYLRLFFLPAGLNIDHDSPISHSLGDHLSWLCLLILLGLTAAAWIYRRRFPLASFGFLLFLFLLAPTSSIVPIRDVLVERRMYLPVFALALAVSDFLRVRSLPIPQLAAGCAAVCVTLSVATWNRNEVWTGAIPLWKNSVANAPHKYRPRFQLAYAHYQAGQCLDANTQYAEAAKLTEKPSFELLVDWALAADCAGRAGEALSRLEEAQRIENNAHVWSLIGMVRAKTGDYDRALEALAQAEAVNPRFAATYLYRGNVLLARREWDAAANAYARAVELDPANANAKESLRRAQASAARSKAAQQKKAADQ